MRACKTATFHISQHLLTQSSSGIQSQTHFDQDEIQESRWATPHQLLPGLLDQILYFDHLIRR